MIPPKQTVYGAPRPSSTHLESHLEQKFRDAVRRTLGGRTFKLITTEAGAPDRMVFLPGGRIYLVELKTETGRVDPAQVVWHAKVAEMGTLVHVIYGQSGLNEWVTARLEDKEPK